jgi:ribosomal protein L40E
MRSRISVAPLAVALLIVTSLTLAPAAVRAQAYSTSFTVTGLPVGLRTEYYVDGVLNGTIQTGETKLLDFPAGGAHTLGVDLNVGGSNGTRYECADNLWSFADAGMHTFVYKTQYYLEVTSAYGSPSGTNWYDEGATAYARIGTNMSAGAEGVRYAFMRWEQDASGQGIVSDPIVMNRAKKAIATWKTQFALKISYDPVGVFAASSSWFDADSVAVFSAPEGTNGTDARQVFVQWAGDYLGTSTQASLQMDGPKSVTAKYKAQYKLSVTYDPPEIGQTLTIVNSTWYDAGQSAALGPVPQVIPVNSVQRFALFSWNVDNMTQQGTSISIAMNGPHRVQLRYQTQYYLSVASSLGETTGTGWYTKGQNAGFGVTYTGSDFPVKHTLTGWTLSSADQTRTLPPTVTEVNMDRPYSVEATWGADYTPLWILVLALASSVIVVVCIAVVVTKKPGSFGRLASSLRSGLKLHRGIRGATTETQLVACQKCGARIPSSAEYCQYCGTVQVRARVPATGDLEALDERVYGYIVKRHGEISLSQASEDLGLSVDDVRKSTERLKLKGRLV